MQRLARIVFKNRFVSSGQDCLTSASPVLLLSLSSRMDASMKDNIGVFSKNSCRISNDCIWKQYREYSTGGFQRQSPETEDHLSKEGSGDFVYSLNASTTNEFNASNNESMGLETRKHETKSESKRLKIEKDVAKQFFENESVDTSNYKLFNLTGNYLLDIGSSQFRWGFPLRRKPKSWKPVPRFYASRSQDTVAKGTMHSYIANVGEGIQRRTRELVDKLKSIGSDSPYESDWNETSEMCPENPFVGCESSSDYRPLQPMAINEVPPSPLVVNGYSSHSTSTLPHLRPNEAEAQNYAMNYVISLKESPTKITESTDQKYWTLMQVVDENKLVNIQPVKNSMLKNWGLLEFFESHKNLHENAYVKIMKVPVRVSMQEVLAEKGRKSIKYIGQHSEVGMILVGENAELLCVVPGNSNNKSLIQPSAENSQEVNTITANLIIACLVGLSSSSKSSDRFSKSRDMPPYTNADNDRTAITTKQKLAKLSGYEALTLNMLADVPENRDPKVGVTEVQEVSTTANNTDNTNRKEEVPSSNKIEMQNVPTFTLVPFEPSTAGTVDGSQIDSCKEKGDTSHRSINSRKSSRISWYPSKSGLQTRKPPMNVGTTCSSHASRRTIRPSAEIDKTVILSRPMYNQPGSNNQYPRVPIVCYPKQKYLAPDEHGRIRYPKPCTYDPTIQLQAGCEQANQAAAVDRVQTPVSYKSPQISYRTLGSMSPHEATLPCEGADRTAVVDHVQTAATYRSPQISHRSIGPITPHAATIPCEESVHAPFIDHIETTVPMKSTQNSCRTLGPTTSYLSERVSPTEATYAPEEGDYESVRTIGEETDSMDSDLSDNATVTHSELSQKPYCDGKLPEDIRCVCPQDSMRLRCCPWYTNQPCPPIPGSVNGQSIQCCPWPCDMPCPEMCHPVVSPTTTEVQACKCVWPCGVPCPRPPIDLPEWTEFPQSEYAQSGLQQPSHPQSSITSSLATPSYDSSYGSLHYQTPSYPSSIQPHVYKGDYMSTLPTGASMVSPEYYYLTPTGTPLPRTQSQDNYNPTKITTFATGDLSTKYIPFSGMTTGTTRVVESLPSIPTQCSYTDCYLGPRLQGMQLQDSAGMQNSSDYNGRDNIASQASYSSWVAANQQTGYPSSGYYTSGESQPESLFYGSGFNPPESQLHASSMISSGSRYYAPEITAPDSQHYASPITTSGSQNYASVITGQNSHYLPSAMSEQATGYYTSPQSQYYASEVIAPGSQHYFSQISPPGSQHYASEISPQDSRYYGSERSIPDSWYYAPEMTVDSRHYASDIGPTTYSSMPSGFPPSGHYTPMSTQEFTPQSQAGFDPGLISRDHYQTMPSRPVSRMCTPESNSPQVYSPIHPSSASTTRSSASCMPCIPCPCCPPNPHPYFIPQHEYLQGTIVTPPSKSDSERPVSNEKWEELQNSNSMEADQQTEVHAAKESNPTESQSNQKLVANAVDKILSNKYLPNIWSLTCLTNSESTTSNGSSSSMSRMSHLSNIFQSTETYNAQKLTAEKARNRSSTEDDGTPPSVNTSGCSITVSAKSLEGLRKKENEGKRDCESVSCSESRSLEEYQPMARIPNLETPLNPLQIFRTMESVLQKTESQHFPEKRYCDPNLFGILNDLGISDLNKSSYCGEWIGSGEVLPVVDPATSSCIADIILPNQNEVERCIMTAKEAGNIWAGLQSPCRSVILNEIARKIAEKSKHLAKLISFEVGKVVPDAMCEVRGIVRMFEYAAGLSSILAGNIFESERSNHIIMERFLPMGTTGIISAFNTPYSTFGKSASISLAVGNTVLLKPAPTTALSSMALMKIIGETFKAYSLPSSVICVQGGSSLGRSLADDKRIDIIAFSGSQTNGHDVGMRVQNRFGKSLLNLAGNNSLLVSHDANFELALYAATIGIVDFAGQKKQKISHIIVHRLLYDQFVENLVHMMKKVSKLCGNPLDPRSVFGPLHSNRITEKYLRAVREIRESGGRIECGGEHIEGNYVEPTIVTGAEAESELVEAPTIGPLAFVFPASDMEEAIEINNKFSNRLNSSVFTKNVVDVYRFIGSKGLAGGVISINTANTGTELTVPLGGDRAAGGGRLSGSNIWQEYCRRVAVNLNFSSSLPYANGSSCTHLGGFQIY